MTEAHYAAVSPADYQRAVSSARLLSHKQPHPEPRRFRDLKELSFAKTRPAHKWLICRL
jgi:hypothetical protein